MATTSDEEREHLLAVGRFQAAPADSIRMPTVFVAASDSRIGATENHGLADLICDGTADDVEIQAAIDALPSGGGKVVLSEGTFTLSAQITRAIDNVTIEGSGAGTLLNLNASTAVISAGSQVAWDLRLFNTDAGGVDISSATESNASYWKADVWTAEPTSVGSGSRSATLVVAANDAAAASKNGADYTCDGTADDVQIQAAIDAAGAGTVVLSEGTFTTAASIDNDTAKGTLRGQGEATIVKEVNSGDLAQMFLIGADDITLRDFVIDGNRSNQSSDGHCIKWSSGARWKFLNLHVKSAYKQAMYMVAGSLTTMDAEIAGCPITDTSFHAVNLEKCRRVRVHHNDINTYGARSPFTYIGILCTTSEQIEIDGNIVVGDSGTAYGSSDTQFDITDQGGNTFRYTWDGTGTDPGTEPEVGNSMHIAAQNFNAANNGDFIVTAIGTSYFEVTNASGVAENDKTVGSGSLNYHVLANFPIQVKISSQDVTVTNNVIVDSEDDGIMCSGSNNVTVGNNVLKNSWGPGISCSNGSNISIMGNTVRGSQGNGIAVDGADGAINDVVVKGNIVTGGMKTGIIAVGSNAVTRVLIEGNVVKDHAETGFYGIEVSGSGVVAATMRVYNNILNGNDTSVSLKSGTKAENNEGLTIPDPGIGGAISVLLGSGVVPLVSATDSGTGTGAVTTTDTTLIDTRNDFTGRVGGVITCNTKTMTITSITTTTNPDDTVNGASWSGGGNPGNGNSWTLTGETRTLAAPTSVGHKLTFNMVTDGGDCEVTCASGINAGNDTIMTFDAIGDTIWLESMEKGSGTYRWRVLGNDGVALS